MAETAVISKPSTKPAIHSSLILQAGGKNIIKGRMNTKLRIMK